MGLAGQKSWSTGWGSTVDGMFPVFSRNLMEVDLPVLSDEYCLYKYPFLHMEKNFCVGETGAGKDTCGGDSGGPLVVESNEHGENKGPWVVAGKLIGLFSRKYLSEGNSWKFFFQF